MAETIIIMGDIVGRDNISVDKEAADELVARKLAAKLAEMRREAEEDERDSSENRSGGVTLNVGGTLTIGGKVYQQDKKESH